MITEWPLPKGGPELAAFLGLATFMRDHIRHYCDMAGPLEPLKKQKVIEWTDVTRDCFHALQRAFKTAPFLAYPDFNRRFVVACDSSLSGAGGVLYQPKDDDDTITPFNIVAICSKKYTATQRNYIIYKKELWAMVYSLRKFHTYIWGKRDIRVYTDHKPLVHILHQQALSVSLQSWLDVILDYDVTIKYRPGILHIIPDALSRLYLHSYKDDKAVWGTHTTIHFVETANEFLSPSDFLCQQSIDASTPSTTVKKRYLRDTASRGGKGSKISSKSSHTNNNNTSTSSSSSTDDSQAAPAASRVHTSPPSHPHYDYVDSGYRYYGDDRHEHVTTDLDEPELLLELECSDEYGAINYVSRYPPAPLRPKPTLDLYNTPLSYVAHLKDAEDVYQASPALKSDDDIVPDVDKDEDEDEFVDVRRLSDQDQLLIAQERRGLHIPPS